MIDKISVLGTEYRLLKGSVEAYPNLKEANAYTDLYSKKIILDEKFGTKEDGFKSSNPESAKRKLYRHEVIHAFISESGFGYNLSEDDEESLVNWIAEQFPKMKTVFDAMGVSEQ